ncbi:MAG: FtsX-like permease family protein [Chitinophagales bacterium]
MKPLALKIAWRYLFSKKSTNVINVITGVTMLGMGVGTMALVLVLSVFNGFEGLVISLYGEFNPDLRVESSRLKTFEADEDLLAKIEQVNGIEHISFTLEEKGILKNKENEFIAHIKGVDSNFEKVSEIGRNVVRGRFLNTESPELVLGSGIQSVLRVAVEDPLARLTVYLPKRGKTTGLSLNPSSAFNRKEIKPVGAFSIQQSFDNEYVLAPIDFLRDLLDYEYAATYAEIKIQENADADDVKQELQNVLGEDYLVKTRYEQNELLYKIMQTEKLAVFAILSFILLIAAFNIIGSLSMLVLEKKKDISILKVLGADAAWIRKLFLLEGFFTSLIGAGGGMIFGFVICLLQIQFGIVKLQGSGSFVIDAYPVDMQWPDFVMVAFLVIGISLIAAYLPAKRAAAMQS